MPDSFFVDPDASGGAATTTVSAPTLGHVERTCSKCGREWEMTRGECACGSHELTERYVEPGVFERGPFGAIRALVTPAKPKAPRATAAQSAELRGFRATVEHFRTELARMDELLRVAVRDDGIEELQSAHGILHQATFMTGDASPESLGHLTLGLRALSIALSSEINHLEEEAPK